MPRIYTDLDQVLIAPVHGRSGGVVNIIPRPRADWFVKKLASKGDLWLLTAADRVHALNGLKTLGPAANAFQGILSWEDLEPIAEMVFVIENEPGLRSKEKAALYRDIEPIAPPGLMFDDYPVGSWVYLIKSAAIGIGPDAWVQVEGFYPSSGDGRGLEEALARL